jgi:hypothetical protein
MILPLSGDDIFGSCVLLQFVSSYYYNGKNETNFQQFCNFFAGWVLAARIAMCKRAPRLGANLVNATVYELRTVRFTLQRNALRLRLSITIRTNSVYCWISVTSLLSNR